MSYFVVTIFQQIWRTNNISYCSSIQFCQFGTSNYSFCILQITNSLIYFVYQFAVIFFLAKIRSFSCESEVKPSIKFFVSPNPSFWYMAHPSIRRFPTKNVRKAMYHVAQIYSWSIIFSNLLLPSSGESKDTPISKWATWNDEQFNT